MRDLKNFPVGKILGKGSGRSAYTLKNDSSLCIKFCDNVKGKMQNEAEVVLWDQMTPKERLRYAKIVSHCVDFSWVVMEKLSSISETSLVRFNKLYDKVYDVDSKYGYCNSEDIGDEDDIYNCGLNNRGILCLYDYGFSDRVNDYYIYNEG